jgi:hypothetical protein
MQSKTRTTRKVTGPVPAGAIAEVNGLDLTLKQALEFKYITAPMSVQAPRACSIFSISRVRSSEGLPITGTRAPLWGRTENDRASR